MVDILVVVWFAAAGSGILAGFCALVSSRRRRVFLLAAGGCFAVAGLLGLASIGILFLVFSAGCFALAGRSNSDGRSTQGPPQVRTRVLVFMVWRHRAKSWGGSLSGCCHI